MTRAGGDGTNRWTLRIPKPHWPSLVAALPVAVGIWFFLAVLTAYEVINEAALVTWLAILLGRMFYRQLVEGFYE